jgi:hypothetical protein
LGKIGNFDYPDWKISDCIEIAKIIEGRFSGRVENQATLAEVLGHKTIKSGGYISKITALRRYGLVAGRGELVTTELAKRIVYPKNPEEQTRALAETVENIELFKRIFERLEEKMPTEDFWVDLVEITGEDRSIAQKDGIKLRNLYMDGYKYLISSKRAEMEAKKLEAKDIPSKIDISSAISAEALFELKTRDYGTLIVKDKDSIGVARKLIDIIEDRIKGKKTETNKEGTSKEEG